MWLQKEYSKTAGWDDMSWQYDHAILKLYDIETKETVQLTEPDWMSTHADIDGDVIVWLDHRNSKCLKLDYMVKIKSADFVKSAEEILNKQRTQEQLSSVRKEIDALHDGYQDINPGDSYTLCYDAETQITELFLNETLLTTVSSEEFAQVYFSIWLGEQNPLSSSLRKNLLSGPAWRNQNG